MKKLTAILLAVLLVLSLSISAFALENKGTITVNGAENGKNYELYKIFDINDVDGSAVYSIPTGKENEYKASAFTDAEGNTLKFTDIFDINTATVDGTSVTYVARKETATPFKITTWAKTNIALFGNAVQTKSTANGTVQFENVAPGYYYVKSPVSDGATAMIADTSLTATVNEKNSTPGWGDEGGKVADGETYYAGDEITYTLTYKNAVNYDQGKQVEKYIIEDTMPDGITYVASSLQVVVKASDSDPGTVVNPTNEGTVTNGFKVSIPWKNDDGTSKYASNPSIIVVTYKAIMGNTKIATGITNTAKIYPNTNDAPGEETEKKDVVYTGKLELNKQDSKTNAPLSGAKFIVKVLVEKTAEGQPNVYKYLKESETTVAGNTVKTYSVVDTEADATKFVTNAEGKITLSGLKANTYVFTEVEAPAGYKLPDNCDLASATLELTKDGDGKVTSSASMSATRTVSNGKAGSMPETGGMGTTLFYLIGGLLAVGAVVMLVTQKRMRTIQ